MACLGEPYSRWYTEMTDPDAVKNEAPPPQPPRPHGQSSSQVEADELYARQLAQRYGSAGAYEARTSSRGYSGLGDNEAEHSFIDDDLPVIRDNLRKGFLDTQTKFNGWFSNFRKRIEEEFNDGGDGAPHAGQGPGSGPARPSGDYDADHRVLGDDFAGMKLSRGGMWPLNKVKCHGKTDILPGPALRTSSNQAPYRQHSNSPRPGDSRRVNFKEPSEEVNMYDSSPKVPPKDAPPKQGKTSKWQPLAEVEPAPMGEMDPFSLGDSDEEKDGKDKTKDSKETREAGSDDNERLRKAAAEAMSDSLVEPSGQESDDKGSHAG